MATDDSVHWLSPTEAETWRALWTVMVWLPARLDHQLQQESTLSSAEYYALSQLSMAPERTARLSELALVANMTLSHLSRVVSRLEKEELLRRLPDPTDGRYTLATLTESGWNKVVDAAPGHVEAVRRYVFDNLTPEQVQNLGEATARIAEKLGRPSPW